MLRERHGTASRFRSALFQLFIRCGARARVRGRAREEKQDKSALVRTSRTLATPTGFNVHESLRGFSEKRVYPHAVSVSSIIALDISQLSTARVSAVLWILRVIKNYTRYVPRPFCTKHSRDTLPNFTNINWSRSLYLWKLRTRVCCIIYISWRSFYFLLMNYIY